MDSDVRFLILIPAYNVAPYLERLVKSIASQTYPHWRAKFVDDCSTDGTPAKLQQLWQSEGIAERFALIENRDRKYKACNIYSALNDDGNDDEIVLMVDGDDALATDGALQRLAEEYESGWEVVWSNWQGTDGSRGTSYYLNPFISPRRQPFVTSHLFSFKKSLFNAIEPEDLQDDSGNWLRAACDVALAWPILDQTIKRKHIPDVLYTYNRDNPLSHDKVGAAYKQLVSRAQADAVDILKKRPGKETHVDNQFLLEHLYEFMTAATASSRTMANHQLHRAVEHVLKQQQQQQGRGGDT